MNRLKGKNIVYIKQLLIILSALSTLLKKFNSLRKSKQKENGMWVIEIECLSLTFFIDINSFKSCTDFVHDLQIDHINLFKILNYLEESKLPQKLQGFVEKDQKQEIKVDEGVLVLNLFENIKYENRIK